MLLLQRSKVFIVNKFMVVVLAAASCALGSTAAQAAVVTISEGGTTIASWTQSFKPKPVSFLEGDYTEIAVDNAFGEAQGVDAYWYDRANNGGGVSYGDNISVAAAQSLSGSSPFQSPESTPTFYTGTYYGVDGGADGLGTTPAIVTISVPEPATWAMMLVGLGMVGFAVRRRRNVNVTYA